MFGRDAEHIGYKFLKRGGGIGSNSHISSLSLIYLSQKHQFRVLKRSYAALYVQRLLTNKCRQRKNVSLYFCPCCQLIEREPPTLWKQSALLHYILNDYCHSKHSPRTLSNLYITGNLSLMFQSVWLIIWACVVIFSPIPCMYESMWMWGRKEFCWLRPCGSSTMRVLGIPQERVSPLPLVTNREIEPTTRAENFWCKTHIKHIELLHKGRT